MTNGEESGIIKIRNCDACGNPISTDESSDSEVGEINPFRYKSYYYDSETRLYYLRSRSYDPAVGRFLNADSTDYLGATGTVLSFNLFAYCENNCVGYFDENGNWFYNYVAFGFQIDLTFGALSGGIEFIFTKDNLEFYAFMYGSLSVTIIDCMEKGLVNALKANIKNLFVKPKSFLKFFSQFELSIGVFMIFRHWY